MDITWNQQGDLWVSTDGQYRIELNRGTILYNVTVKTIDGWLHIGERTTLRRAQVCAQVHAA